MQKLVLLSYDRYQRLLTAKDNVANSTIVDASPSPTIDIPVKDESERLISLFPKTLQARARGLLTYILPYISWNEKGEVTINGEKIPNSNIVDLIKVQLKDYKDFRPLGVEQFVTLLKDVNVPLSLLTLYQREQIGQGKLPPPPGIAVKRSAVIPKKPKVKWLKR